MHTFTLLLIFICLAARIHSRPSQVDESNDSGIEEAEYEGENSAAADDSGAEEDPGLKDQEMSEENRQLEKREKSYLRRNAVDQSRRANLDEFSDYKPIKNKNFRAEKSDDMKNTIDDFQTVSKDSMSNRYIENNDANELQETAQHLANRDVKSNRLNDVLQNDLVNKRTNEYRSVSNDEGDMLFENSREHTGKVDKDDYNKNGAFDSNEQSRYVKQYYNPKHTGERVIMYQNDHDNDRLYLDRNRRQAQGHSQGDSENVSSTQDEKEELKKSASEDEESAIKRHIKKMSGEELEGLLNSLSEEKRELLKKIIDSAETADNGFESINKREITKKAGAIGENSYNEGGLSDSSKMQGSNPYADVNNESSVTQNIETTETNKRIESQTENDISSSKGVDPNGSKNKADISGATDTTDKLDLSLNSCAPDLVSKNNVAEVVSSLQVPSKIENKRETNLDDPAEMGSEEMSLDDSNIFESDLKDTPDSFNDQSYFCSQDEDLSQLQNDEVDLNTDNGKINKREIQEQADLTDSMKSLEESFPNSEAYSDASGPHTGNLVRVKRKSSEQVLKKRSAAHILDSRVPYFPYRAENDDEDTDEGNEFDEDGFYDPPSNFVKLNNDVEDLSSNDLSQSEQIKTDKTNFDLNGIDRRKLPKNGDDKISLGSDTDSVLMGVEGVDDNLMYKSGLRNRRTLGNGAEDVPDIKADQPSHSATLLANAVNTESENYNINSPTYQENEAFGPPPKNEGDLGRYKRIRRVMQSHNFEDASSDK